jgi:hypothetical protein
MYARWSLLEFASQVLIPVGIHRLQPMMRKSLNVRCKEIQSSPRETGIEPPADRLDRSSEPVILRDEPRTVRWA